MEKRHAIYCRVSTDQQATGLEAQRRALEQYCQARGITNYEVFEDFNISGMKSSRPELDRMIEAVKRGEISRVMVYSFSRFARSTRHLLDAMELFKSLDVEFLSITEQVDTTTSFGKMIFTVLAALAQLERDPVSNF